jgi:hypothetical protein
MESLEKLLGAAFAIGFGILIVLAALAWISIYWSAHFRGDRVGSLFGHAQGEGVRFAGRMRIVVRRRDLGEAPDVSLRFQGLGKVLKLEAAEAIALAEALDRVVREVREGA